MKPLLFAVVFLLCQSLSAGADEIRIAVASNFAPTLKILARTYEKQSEHRLVLATGSSGKHYAQISHGAPFDLFFSADVKRPKLLEHKGLTIAGSRFTYAYGQLVLWQPQGNTTINNSLVNKQTVNNPLLQILKRGDFRYLAIANPGLAPYGAAAEQTLIKLDLWDKYRGRIVRGENIAQTFHFIISGNAQLGFVALAQIKNSPYLTDGMYWEVPATYYQPIEQQAVQLTDSPAALAFIQFLDTTPARQIIRQAGYLTATENRP